MKPVKLKSIKELGIMWGNKWEMEKNTRMNTIERRKNKDDSIQ